MSNITILRGGAIGDFVLTLPAIHAIRNTFPDKGLRLIGRPDILALSGLCDLIDHDDPRLIALHRDGPIPPETHALFANCERLLAYAVDPTGCLQRQLDKIVRGPVLLWDPRPPATPPIHIVNHLLAPLDQWDIAPADATPRIDCPSTAQSYSRQIIIHPGSGATKKCWPEQRFGELGAALGRRGWPTAFLRGPVETERGIAANLPTVQAADLPSLADLLSRARLFIGNDSGPGHIAAAVGTPTLSLFGPTDPRVWAPRHPNGRVLQASGDDLADIPLDAVLETALQMLATNGDG